VSWIELNIVLWYSYGIVKQTAMINSRFQVGAF